MSKTFELCVFAFALLTAVACSDSVKDADRNNETGGAGTGKGCTAVAESLMQQAKSSVDSDRLLWLADSLEATGDMSHIAANYYRGGAYSLKQQVTLANEYLRKVKETDHPSKEDMKYYLNARTLLAQNLLERNFQSALEEAMPLAKLVDSLPDIATYSDKMRIRYVIANSQLHLEHTDEANESFEKLYGYTREWLDEDPEGAAAHSILAFVFNTTSAYLDANLFDKAELWAERSDSVLRVCKSRPEADPEDMEFFRGAIELCKARAYEGTGQPELARSAYASFKSSPFGEHEIGLINSTYYLLDAGRYDEAANNLTNLDQIINDFGYDMDLSNIKDLLIPKLRANLGAGRRDSALAIAKKITEVYDSAYDKQIKSNAAELAIVFATHEQKEMLEQKENELKERNARLQRIRLLALNGGLIVLSVFFIIFSVNRHRNSKRMKEKNRQLQEAYDKLEETTTIKERMESELRIARNIQMSMVPSVFPDVDNLDMYGSMTPAKEVGGDLYNYMVHEGKLYFCIGDVSGKGVPASLFMAVATRGFRTLAMTGKTPAEITTRLNYELNENNEQSMFVTMFICRLDLETNRLEYCNAGHNPPVLKEPDGTIHFLESEPNAPVGLWPGLEYEGAAIDDFKGFELLLYTDGLNEAENKEQDQYGDERIISFISSHATSSSRDLIEMIKADVEQFRNGAEPNDDLTMLAIRYTQTTPPEAAQA